MRLTKHTILKICIIFACIISLCTFYFQKRFRSILDNDYLKQNSFKICLKNKQNTSDLNILDNDIKGKEIFLTGEEHGNSANCQLKMKFLKYFKEKTDFKYLLSEYSYSEACYLNDYLKSGDIKILQDIFSPLKGTAEWNIDSYNFWKELYKFNNELPNYKRIQVIGIDIEHQLITAYSYINSILPSKKEPQSIHSSIEAFRNIYDKADKNISNDEINLCFAKIQKDLYINQKEYKKYLGSHFFEFQYTINNIIKKQQCYKIDDLNDETEFFRLREKCMYDNFGILYNSLPKGKYYGQFGTQHVLQHKSNITESFITKISNTNPNFKNKIYSIGYVYEQCKAMFNGTDKKYHTYCLNYTNGLNTFKPYLNNDVTLFKLNQQDSPFRKKMNWPYSGTELKSTDGVLTDYLQSIVVIKGFEASKPLNDVYN